MDNGQQTGSGGGTEEVEMVEVEDVVEKMFGPDVAMAGGSRSGGRDTADSKVMENENKRDCIQPDGKPQQVDLGVVHRQCCAARAINNKVEVTCITGTGAGQTILGEPYSFGALNSPEDELVGKTFRGARVKKGNDTVNQSVTMSIDPATLTCLSCEREHSLLQGNGKPLIIMISDQNFVSMWPVTTLDHCVCVLRMVNPSLVELVDLLLEIFDRNNIPDGSVVLFGAVSYLHRVGVSVYAREWVHTVGRLSRRWPNVRSGPLIPLITEKCPGGGSKGLN